MINGRYKLTGPVGAGSMATVWRGFDLVLERSVAIKRVELDAGLLEAERAELSGLVLAEARATARLRHPGIVAVFDVLDDDGTPLIVMELVEGESLAELLDREVRLSHRRAAEIGAAVLGALGEAHRTGIVHRDLKPANILLSGDRVVLTDFGISRRIGESPTGHPGDMSGTPAFVAPEQAENSAASPAADLWSLGATLFAAVEGRPPYLGSGYADTLLLLLTQDPPTPRSAGPLTDVIMGLLHKDPAQRAPADQVAAALDQILHPSARTPSPPDPRPAPPAPTPRPPAPSQQWPAWPAASRRRRGPVRAWIAAVVALTTGISGVMVLGGAVGPSAGRVPAEIKTAAYSSDGMMLAIGVQAGVRLYDVASRKLKATLHSSAVGTSLPDVIAFNRDDSLLAVGGAGFTELWNLKAHRQIATGQLGGAEHLAFSHDGNTLTIACYGGQLEVINPDTHHDSVLGKQDTDVFTTLGPGGTVYARTKQQGGEVEVWTVNGHRRLGHFAWHSALSGGGAGPVMAFSPDGEKLAIGIGDVQLWDVATGKEVGRPVSGLTSPIFSMAFSPNGRELALGTAGGMGTPGQTLVYGLATGARLAAINGGRGQPVGAVSFNPSGQTLAIVHRPNVFEAGSDEASTAQIWDLTTQKMITQWTGAI